MSVHFHDNPACLPHAELLAYVDNLEGWLRELIVPPDVAMRLQREFRLAPGEARILAVLADGKPKSRAFLCGSLYSRPPSEFMDPTILDVRMCTLRRKVKARGIRIDTIRRMGYVMVAGKDVVAPLMKMAA